MKENNQVKMNKNRKSKITKRTNKHLNRLGKRLNQAEQNRRMANDLQKWETEG